MALYEGLSSQIKDPARRSDEKVRLLATQGADFSHSKGRMMEKVRIIDKDNDRYFEKIVDPVTGEIVHLCDEALSAHWGHGSAKKKKDQPT